jgi:riboflavin biosynthesis pyrimidine reductase
MMMTIDGKIASGSPEVDVVDDYLDVYREVDNNIVGPVTAKGVAWCCGRVTTEAYFAKGKDEQLPEPTMPTLSKNIILQDNGRYFVTVDTKGTLRWESNTISFYPEHGTLGVIVVITEATPKSYLAYLQSKNIAYICAGDQEVDFAKVTEKLAKNFGINLLMLEGGAKINGSLMDAGLVDEISLLVLPRVLNKEAAPSVFSSSTNEAGVWVDYRFDGATPMARGSVLLKYTKVK